VKGKINQCSHVSRQLRVKQPRGTAAGNQKTRSQVAEIFQLGGMDAAVAAISVHPCFTLNRHFCCWRYFL